MRHLSFILLSAFVALTATAQEKNPADSTRVKDLDNIIVTGTKSATTARNVPFTISVVNREKLTENQRINVLPTLTEQVPGLFVTQRGMLGYGVSTGAAGGINLRGISAGSGQVLVLIDGHPQYQGVFGHSISDAYQTMMTERVEVLRGPSSVLYGSNAMGGVINIITRNMKKDGVKTHINLGAGSWGTVLAEASNQFRKGKFSSTFAGQYSRTDNHRPDMGFEQYGGYGKIAYDFSNNWTAFMDMDLTHFNSSYPGTTSSPMYEADQWITRGMATLAVENNYAKTNGRVSVYNNWGYHKINDGYGPKASRKTPQTDLFESTDALLGFSWYQSANLWKGSNITLGMDYQHIYGHAYYTDILTGDVVTTKSRLMQSANEKMDEVGVYVDARQDLTSWLTVDAGIRYDYHNVSGKEWIPQFAIMARPTSKSELRISASKGFRNPTLKDMYLYASANDDLKPERMWNYEVSWRQRLCDGRFNYGVNLFLIEGDNMIQTINRKNVNTGYILNRGAELEATWNVCKLLSLTTNHSYLYMRNHVLGAPKYKGYLGATLRHSKWAATMGIQQIAGLYTEVGTDNDHMENFTLLNVTVSYQVLKQLGLWVKGDNLLSQKYQINDGYPMPRATFMGGVNINF